jgi:2',3'-cyclic-nucleotide 2'-phosphodiesterase/3'-nucleotidase
MKKNLTAIAAMLAMVSCATLKNGTHTIDIVSINDVQGRWFNEPYTEGGKVRGSLEALSDSISRWHDKAGRTSLLIDAGDELTGGDANFYYDYIDTLGPHVYPSMASFLGVNAIIPSQEDISSPSWRRVSAQLKEQGISVIEGSDYKIFKLKGGIRVAVLGSCEALPAASAKKPALVILKSNGKQIPSDLTGIDVVLAAHDHRAYAITSDSTCIIDGGSYARNFGHASVTLNVKHHEVASKHFDASAPFCREFSIPQWHRRTFLTGILSCEVFREQQDWDPFRRPFRPQGLLWLIRLHEPLPFHRALLPGRRHLFCCPPFP